MVEAPISSCGRFESDIDNLRSLRQKNQMTKQITLRRAIPPITPPTIGPSVPDDLLLLLLAAWDGVTVTVTGLEDVEEEDVEEGCEDVNEVVRREVDEVEAAEVEPGVMEAEGPTRRKQ